MSKDTHPMNEWNCEHCGWSGEDPPWDEYESRRLCPECGDSVERKH